MRVVLGSFMLTRAASCVSGRVLDATNNNTLYSESFGWFQGIRTGHLCIQVAGVSSSMTVCVYVCGFLVLSVVLTLCVCLCVL